MSEGTGTYVYAVVSADADLPADMEPVGGSPDGIAIIEHGDLAAVVSDVATDKPLGKRADLMAHERVVNAIAAETTVLPMRFGGVVKDDRAVVDELLAEHHDWFVHALAELDGVVEYVLHGRYDEDVLLSRIIEQNSEIAHLSEQVRGQDPDATYYERIRLGEAISREVDGARAVDATAAEQWLGPYAEAVVTKEVDGEDGAVHLAVLVRRDRLSDFEQAVDSLGDDWDSRVSLRLIGPVAPYDFLPQPAEGSS
jgi:hypothetical protein